MLQAILGAAGPILDKFVEDKDAKNKIKAELEQLSLIHISEPTRPY